MGIRRVLYNTFMRVMLGKGNELDGIKFSKAKMILLLTFLLGNVGALLPFDVPDELTINAAEYLVGLFIRDGIG